VTTPLLTNSRRVVETARASFGSRLIQMGTGVAVGFGALIGILVYLGLSEIRSGDAALAIAAALALIGIWAREHRRAFQYLGLDSWGVLRGDLVYSVVIFAAIVAGSLFARSLTAAFVLVAIGMAGVVTGKLVFRRNNRTRNPEDHGNVGGILRSQASWTIPSVILSWAYSNSYLYIVAGVAGLGALAELSAARLLVAPVSLIQVAWNRLYLPSAGADFAAGNPKAAFRGAWVGVAMVIGGTLLYGAILISALTVPAFSHFRRLSGVSTSAVLLWMGYFLVNGARGIATNLHMAQTAFRRLFVIGLLGTGVAIGCMVILGQRMGTSGILLAMIGGEAALTAMLWIHAAKQDRGLAA
jgi:O-antigen/teichoic acid export membrane protein